MFGIVGVVVVVWIVVMTVVLVENIVVEVVLENSSRGSISWKIVVEVVVAEK